MIFSCPSAGKLHGRAHNVLCARICRGTKLVRRWADRACQEKSIAEHPYHAKCAKALFALQSTVRGYIAPNYSLPCEVSESAICFGHPVRVVFLSHSEPFIVGGIDYFFR